MTHNCMQAHILPNKGINVKEEIEDNLASVAAPKMSEEALKNLQEQLNCSICLDIYTDPKLLKCFHVFCHQCLVPLGVRDQQALTCPTCRQVTPIPDRGVSGLQPAFHINNLRQIYEDSVKKLQNPAATPEG